MANASRPPAAPVRKVVAGVLGTVAVFVMLFGVGRQSWSTVAIGAALLLLAFGLLAVTAARGGAQAWVIGTAHVHSASEPPASSTFGRCEMQLVIDAPGLSPRSIKVRDPLVPVAKWPDPGATLPVTVALDDPRRVRILWDEVLTHAEAAEAEATGTAAGAAAGATEGWPRGRAGSGHAEQQVFVAEREEPLTESDPDVGFSPPVTTEPVTADLTEELRDLRRFSDEVVVHRAPGGPPIIEGILVDPPASIPFPRRTSSHPYSPPAPVEEVYPETSTAGVATVTEPSLAADQVDPDQPEPTGEVFAGVGVTLLVADLGHSVRFYADVLGLRVVDRGETNAVLASGPTRLVVRAVREVAPVNRRLVHLNLEVADIETAYARLRDKGVRFTYAPRMVNRGSKLEVWAAAFRDPDGHGVALMEWRDRPPSDRSARTAS